MISQSIFIRVSLLTTDILTKELYRNLLILDIYLRFIHLSLMNKPEVTAARKSSLRRPEEEPLSGIRLKRQLYIISLLELYAI